MRSESFGRRHIKTRTFFGEANIQPKVKLFFGIKSIAQAKAQTVLQITAAKMAQTIGHIRQSGKTDNANTFDQWYPIFRLKSNQIFITKASQPVPTHVFLTPHQRHHLEGRITRHETEIPLNGQNMRGQKSEICSEIEHIRVEMKITAKGAPEKQNLGLMITSR